MVPKGRQGWPSASHSQFHVPTAGSHSAPQPDWWGLCETFLRKGRNTSQAMRNKEKKVLVTALLIPRSKREEGEKVLPALEQG